MHACVLYIPEMIVLGISYSVISYWENNGKSMKSWYLTQQDKVNWYLWDSSTVKVNKQQWKLKQAEK